MNNRIFLCAAAMSVAAAADLSAQSPWAMADSIVAGLDPVIVPDMIYDVTDFGASGDGSTPSKDAFDRAMTECSDNGGGRIVVPRGVYYMDGPLVFKSN